MNAVRLTGKPSSNGASSPHRARPSVSVVVPAYNEAAIIAQTLETVCRCMGTLCADYRWDLVVVDDGSRDDTGDLAEAFAKDHHNVCVLHHAANCGLGQALKSAFEHCQSDYIVTLDADLSYAPDHIPRLLNEIRKTRADIVIASPYMTRGKRSHIPWVRSMLSLGANRFLSWAAPGRPATLTGMVRAYRGPFVKGLYLASSGMEVNVEILYKAAMGHARIVEIPAHLNWEAQKERTETRRSSMHVAQNILATLRLGFLFRPGAFFALPGLLLLVVALGAFCAVAISAAAHGWTHPLGSGWGAVYQAAAATFKAWSAMLFACGLAFAVGIQLIGLGLLALQNKQYFEEQFLIESQIYKTIRKNHTEDP